MRLRLGASRYVPIDAGKAPNPVRFALAQVLRVRVHTLLQTVDYRTRIGEYDEGRHETASTPLPHALIRVVLAQSAAKLQPCTPNIYLVTARR
jgi:hypothetical protein